MSSSIAVQLNCGLFVKIEAFAAQSFCIHASRSGLFSESPLSRYGILNPLPAAEDVSRADGEHIVLAAGGEQLTVSKQSGAFALRSADGVLRTSGSLLPDNGFGESTLTSGVQARLALADGERLYGLGDRIKDRIQIRGLRAEMRMTLDGARAPLPFVMSSRGWAVFVLTTRRHVVDAGCASSELLQFGAGGDELVFYLFGADGPGALLERYTALTGRPELLPMWAYGLIYISHQYASARDIIEDGLNFRRDGIPCDTIGLEPGWMEKYHDYSTAKQWHPERFAIPSWNPAGPRTFFGALDRMGFKLSLWLCCNFDLTREAERQWAERQRLQRSFEDAEGTDTLPSAGEASDGEASDSRVPEAWYDHLRKFVEQGVAAFKLEGYEFDHIPDLQWFNGMSSEEMHHLYQLLLCKQMHEGFVRQTGRRPLLFSMSGFAGIQQYGATWTADAPDSLIGLLNQNISGHFNGAADIDVQTPSGIHRGFLQTLAQVNSWMYWQHPTLLEPRLQQMFRLYAKLRYKWLPYLYSAAYEAWRTGKQVMRPMPLVCPNDLEADSLTTQYMLGDALLVGSSEQVYLPAGEWMDYWTGRRYSGPRHIVCEVPDYAGGPLLLRGGSIMTEWPEVNHISQPLPPIIGVRVYPYGSSGETVLYEDDGSTFAYRQGACTTAAIRFQNVGERLRIELSPRSGDFPGMPGERGYDVTVLCQEAPSELRVNGKRRPYDATGAEGESGWQYDSASGEVRIRVAEDADRRLPAVIELYFTLAPADDSLRLTPASGPTGAHSSVTDNPLIGQVLELLEKEYGRNDSLQAVAARLHVNSSHLSRLFKREIGVSYTAYVVRRKMEHAKRLLQDNHKIEEIADTLGYTDASHFIRTFRSYWGLTPGRWQAEAQNALRSEEDH